MAARSKARKRALDALYAADLRGVDAVTLLAEREAPASAGGAYAETIVAGVSAHRGRIDGLIADHAVGWTLERMPPVDLAILRIGVYELLFSEDVPGAVVVDEAVQLAKTLSTDKSPGFVNGVLGQVLGEVADQPRPV